MNGGAGQLATVISPTPLNELRFGLNRRVETRDTYVSGQPNGSQINITGVASFGVNPLAGSASVETSTQVIDNLTWSFGRHTLKAGVDYQSTGFQITAAGRPAVTPLDQYLRTVARTVDPATSRPYTYTQLQQELGENAVSLRYHFVNFFLQDELRLTPRLTLKFGVRYEAVLNPVLDDKAPYELSRHSAMAKRWSAAATVFFSITPALAPAPTGRSPVCPNLLASRRPTSPPSPPTIR